MKGCEWETECNGEIIFQIKCQENRNVESALVVSLPGDSMKELSHLQRTGERPVPVKGAHKIVELFSGLCMISHFLLSVKGEQYELQN